jgi:hypothetical protein
MGSAALQHDLGADVHDPADLEGVDPVTSRARGRRTLNHLPHRAKPPRVRTGRMLVWPPSRNPSASGCSFASPSRPTDATRGFSMASRRISPTTSSATGGRPLRGWACVHLRVTSRRCQRRIVAGVTRKLDRRPRGSALLSAASTARSGVGTRVASLDGAARRAGGRARRSRCPWHARFASFQATCRRVGGS